MSNPFQSVLVKKPGLSRFDLSHDVKTSSNFQKLTPVLCQEVLPGDTWRLYSEVFMRTMPLITPVMHQVDVYMYHFFVPYRIIWHDWNKFWTGGDNNKTELQIPIFRVNRDEYNTYIAHKGHIGDYFGLPKMVKTSSPVVDMYDINALPFIAYRMILENYFIDQNLQDLWFDDLFKYLMADNANCIITSSSTLTYINKYGTEVTINLLDALTAIGTRCWEHDYFTSSLPNTQRGDDVHLPMYGNAPLKYSGEGITTTNYNNPNSTPSLLGVKPGSYQINAYDMESMSPASQSATSTPFPIRLNVTNSTYVDLSAALGATINDFREAMQLQRYNELVQRVGNRFKENIRGLYGINISDKRLDLPEYLGGGKAPIVISEVLQQSQTTEQSPQGTMAGKAISASVFGNKKHHFFEEHGVIISILSVRPRSSYSQGVPKLFRKFDRFEYGNPMFAQLGEQAVKTGELYWADDGHNDDTFGYLPRYSEYKVLPSLVTGELRDTLTSWHLGRIFDTRPVLNGDFVSLRNDNFSRIFAVTDGGLESEFDPLIFQIFHHIRVRRPLPFYGTPI